MGLKDEQVVANNPPEEEEEEELVDPHEGIREQCQEAKECEKYKAELDACTDRVNSKSKTTETCMQELYDFVHCVDHCIAEPLWKHMK